MLNQRKNKSIKRRAIAITELALSLPLIVLVALATIETCSMLYLKQGLRISAYEGARVALVPGSAFDNVKAGCDQILAARKIKEATVTVTPSDFPSQPYGTVVTVKVSAPCAANSLFVPFLFSGKTLDGEMHMMLER